ncbi:hypothetical protein B0P06_005278 [Clostridium saccharoperbutylacetonicum]|uniref:Uncharacterized protein n=1 Tax=Clostridium saccharoperbutylacetonicum N1-4(HMT) TaxID=931276 RepID=M1MEW2_9CLOT|nr:hypothetical protein [Clostridium saccharoperbutylacetonicum]AGF56454.1 hypothetical protein Cspa_c26890 [Clostridium saccharoperbutylacetonicum N1-4(HMT)]NRT62799.1 hypothetical protein [Clostridium saccharoperbutylacetonicum]NSB26153.1 hypothetical protein [Clostridium saccharoperbutylacetonicum]NSB45507.1 hypothetical protein [Clostridium saccharoperbutylacetonicum]
MYKISLNKNLFDYLIKNLNDEKIKEALSKKDEENGNIHCEIDVDTKIDLLDYIEDLQLEIGFDNEDYLNEDGKIIQEIYDQIYKQTNK